VVVTSALRTPHSAGAAATCVLQPAPDRPAGRGVYVYFDNDAKGARPFDAIRLAERLG
jgi:hypothetical protein